MKRVAFHTLGCKLNYAETARIGRQFSGNGYSIVGIDEPADVIVINSCSVTEHADRDCRQLIRRAHRHSPDAFVAVVGCYAQLRPETIAGIDGVDLVLGTKEKFSILEHLPVQRNSSRPEIIVSCIDELQDADAASSAGFEDRTRAFLKIQDGCDYRCSFCTIPKARGNSRSIPGAEIVSQAESAVAQGYKEIVLTGVNVGDYGKSLHTDLLGLLRLLVRVDGLRRIRISSIEPNLLTDDLLEFWAGEEKLCSHWHIPLQSGSDPVLRAMRRRYARKVYEERIARIRALVPHAGIGSDVIVGFPGETEPLFQETYRFLADVPVSYLHVFSYSERDGTDAARMEQKIEPKIKSERSRMLRQLGARKKRDFSEQFVGNTVSVLVETGGSDGACTGLTEEYVRVEIPSGGCTVNEIVPVRIDAATGDCCTGTIVHRAADASTRIAEFPECIL